MECPKCKYLRRSIDTGPSYECPSCGIVYSKFDPTLEAKRAALRAKAAENEIEAIHSPTVVEQSADVTLNHPTNAQQTDQPNPPTQALVTNCPACGGVVAFGIKACIHCGMAKPAPKPKGTSQPIKKRTAVFTFLFLGVMFVIASKSDLSTTSPTGRLSSKPEMRLGAQQAVQAAGYTCNSINDFKELLVGTGFSIKCDNYSHNYTIKDVGGRIVVRVD